MYSTISIGSEGDEQRGLSIHLLEPLKDFSQKSNVKKFEENYFASFK